MFYLRTKRANKIAGFTLLVLSCMALALSSWLKHVLHLGDGHVGSAIEFASGVALGIGICFALVDFSSDLGDSDFQE